MPRPRARETTKSLPKRLRPRRVPSQSRSRALVEAIMQAGAQELIDHGWEGTTLANVAARAGVSPGSLYQYFPDKASLVTALIEAQSQRELAFHLERFSALDPTASLEALVHTLMVALVEFQRREGPLMRRTLEALQHIGRYDELASRARRAAEALEAVLSLHRHRLAIDDVALATHVISNAIHSLTHDGVLARPSSLDDATLVRELERLALGYLVRRDA